MHGVSEYAVLAVAGWSSGISLYLTVAVLGVAGRAGWIALPGRLDLLSEPLVIAAALFLYFIEFFADKVPVVDTMWDSIHTFVRPLGAAAIGYLAASGDGSVAQILTAGVTGTVALGTHATKAAGRMAINLSPEPFSNIAASLVEHSAVLGIFWLVATNPFLALVVVSLLIVGTIVALRALWRFGRRVFSRRKAAPVSP